MFGGSPLVAVSAYFIGMAAIICSGIILKKTKIFAGDVYKRQRLLSSLASTSPEGRGFMHLEGTLKKAPLFGGTGIAQR